MTTNKTATLDTAKLVTTGLPASTTPKPEVVIVTGPTIPAMQQVAHLVRLGYVPDSNLPLEFFGHSGAISITLVRGAPEQYAIDAAVETLHQSQALQEANYARDVAKEAARQIAAAKDAEAIAARTKLIEEQRAELAKLEKTMSANSQALAKLEAANSK